MNSISDSTTADNRGIRKWFVAALLVSLLFHAGLFEVFKVKTLDRFATGVTEHLVPTKLSLKRVKLDPKIFDSVPPKAAARSTPIPKPAINVPEEKPFRKLPEKVTYTPASPNSADPAKALLSAKPNIAPSAQHLPQQENAAEQSALDTDLKNQLLERAAPKVAGDSGIILPPSNSNEAETGKGGPDKGAGSNYSDLDELLGRSGPLNGNEGPVSMPGGALFDYDRTDLRADAIEMLHKIGLLIQKYPRATFRIEGHSDSFGSPDYNFKLSEARAESVKTWLVENMHIDPAIITTKGFGSTQLRVPASASREAQEINRRVEIVILNPKD